MRAIEFRFYDLTNEKMVYLGDEYFSLCAFLCAYETKKTSTSDLMQYTGLKDAEGNKIFEGDIVLTPGYPYWNYSVVSRLDIGTFVTELEEGICDEWTKIHWNSFKVIGNKYQHKELLNEQK